MKRPHKTLWVLALLPLLFTGCVRSQKAFQPGFVYRDWSARMSEMGIYPVFPPREDIMVGDIYLLPTHPYDSELLDHLGGVGNAGLHLAYFDQIQPEKGNKELPISKILSDYYRTRMTFPDTTNAFSSDLALTGIPGLNSSGVVQTNVFAGQIPLRLRQVAFPEFAVTTVDQGSLAALVPIEAIGANLGFSASSASRISFKLPQAESYSLPSDLLLTGFLETNMTTIPASDGTQQLVFRAWDRKEGTRALLFPYAPALARSMFDQSIAWALKGLEARQPITAARLGRRLHSDATNYVYLGVITEVYYARSMDISIDFQSGRAFSAEVKPLTIDELKALKDLGSLTATNPAPASTNSSAAVGARMVEVNSSDDAFALADKYRKLNLGYPMGVPGGSISLLSVGDRSVGLRRTFQRPIAVGVRGVLMRLNIHPLPLPGGGYGFPVELSPGIPHY